MTETIKLSNGSLPIPEDERAKAGIGPDDELFVTVAEGLILLTTRPSALDKHAREFARLMDQAGIDEEELLAGLSQVRETIYHERYGGG